MEQRLLFRIYKEIKGMGNFENRSTQLDSLPPASAVIPPAIQQESQKLHDELLDSLSTTPDDQDPEDVDEDLFAQ